MKAFSKKFLTAGALAVGSCVMALSAKADVTPALGDNLSLNAVGVDGLTHWYGTVPAVNVNYSGIGPTNASGSGVSAPGGQIDWTGTDSNQGNKAVTPFLTYCVQLTTDITVPSSANYKVTTLGSTPDVSGTAADIASLAATNTSELVPEGTYNSTDAAGYLAFQVAVWDLVYNGTSGPSFKSGVFNVSAGVSFNIGAGSIANAADADLQKIVSSGVIDTSSVTLQSDGGYKINPTVGGVSTFFGQVIYGLTGDGTQDQTVLAVGSGGPGFVSTPLPKSSGTLACLMGITGLVGWRRSQRNKLVSI